MGKKIKLKGLAKAMRMEKWGDIYVAIGETDEERKNTPCINIESGYP